MPQWGLDKEMRRSEPWDLPEYWLRPSKVITDPIHEDIFLTKLEKELVDTPAFQRLRRVRQLGTTHLVYPGATHTRFAHSLGALRAVQDLFDAAYDQRNGHHAIPDLFTQWESDVLDTESGGQGSLGPEGRRKQFVTKVAEATVLARLGALLHDLCHVAFGHSLEDDLKVLMAHDKNAWRFDRLWDEVLDSIREHLAPEHVKPLKCLAPGGELYEQLRPLILSKEEFKGPGGERKRIEATDRLKYPFVADIVGNTICADLTDYLERDHTFLGLPISLGSRFMSAFYVTPSRPSPLHSERGPLYQERMAVLLHREGHIRKDIVTELLKHLRYRYELQERALVHHAKLAADAMVGRLLELWISGTATDETAGGASSEPHVSRRGRRVVVKVFQTDGTRWENVDTSPSHEAEPVEDLLRAVGDDGFLESLAIGDASAPVVRSLASDLLNRNLYKRLARTEGAYAAHDLYEQFGKNPVTRRTLEREAARYAQITPDWHLILWFPPPTMRLKLAEMLVDHGQGIAKFVDYSPQGSEIYEAHRALWNVSVYGHPTLREEQERAALVRLAELMGVCWDRYIRQLGPEPTDWGMRNAALEVFNEPRMTDEIERFLESVELDQIQARSHDEPDYRARRATLRAIAKSNGFNVRP